MTAQRGIVMKEINFEYPSMEEQELFTSYFRKYPSRSCERTFVNVYLWSKFYRVTYAMVEDCIVFRSEQEDGFSFAFPVGEDAAVKRAVRVLMEYSEERGQEFSMYNVTPEYFEKLESMYPGQFEIAYDRDIADYVYESEKLASLAGKKLHGKRNHINKFKTLYEDWEYETVTRDNLEDCFQMALKWRNLNECDADEEKNAEMCVTLNSLRLFEELGLSGGLIRVNGEVVAFTLGEHLCGDTFVVHIEKAFADVQGAYPIVNQQFVQHECMEYAYINREEDTGAEGLRKAKLSYHPVFLVEKGNVTKKK